MFALGLRVVCFQNTHSNIQQIFNSKFKFILVLTCSCIKPFISKLYNGIQIPKNSILIVLKMKSFKNIWFQNQSVLLCLQVFFTTKLKL